MDTALAHHPDVHYALVPVPAFTRPTAAGVLAHFAHVAAASPVPVVVYHVPPRTGQPLDAETLRRLGRLPGIAGIKYATGTVDPDAVSLLADRPAHVAVLAGDDVVAAAMLALGAPGGILASAHLATDRYAALATAWRDGDAGTARHLGPALTRLSAAVFAAPNPTVVKGVLHAQGRIPTADVRMPLLPAAPDVVEEALARLSEVV